MRKTVVPGYLIEYRAAGVRALGIKVPCGKCGVWHLHGAGTVDDPLYRPGEVTDRSTHCVDREEPEAYTHIKIRPEPFRKSWQRATRRKSAAITRTFWEWQAGRSEAT